MPGLPTNLIPTDTIKKLHRPLWRYFETWIAGIGLTLLLVLVSTLWFTIQTRQLLYITASDGNKPMTISLSNAINQLDKNNNDRTAALAEIVVNSCRKAEGQRSAESATSTKK